MRAELREDIARLRLAVHDDEIAAAWKVFCGSCERGEPRLLIQEHGARHPTAGNGPTCPDCGGVEVVLDEIEPGPGTRLGAALYEVVA